MTENRHTLDRRTFCTLTGGAAVSIALSSACSRRELQYASTAGRVTARPHESYKSYIGGRMTLGLDSVRDAIVQTPKAQPNSNIPLVVFFHGAGQSAEEMLNNLGTVPEEEGVAVLAPNSRDKTWDAIKDGAFFGPDVKFLNRALELVFEMLAIDGRRVFMGGFSDGASYAISLGLLNGDLFSRVMAFSPGGVIDGPWVGKPRFYISYGKRDPIVPLNKSREIVGELNMRAYGVTGREFDGGHETCRINKSQNLTLTLPK